MSKLLTRASVCEYLAASQQKQNKRRGAAFYDEVLVVFVCDDVNGLVVFLKAARAACSACSSLSLSARNCTCTPNEWSLFLQIHQNFALLAALLVVFLSFLVDVCIVGC